MLVLISPEPSILRESVKPMKDPVVSFFRAFLGQEEFVAAEGCYGCMGLYMAQTGILIPGVPETGETLKREGEGYHEMLNWILKGDIPNI